MCDTSDRGHVHVLIKAVKNLGDYNTLHLEAGLDRPLREGESWPEAFDKAYAACEAKISEKIDSLVAELRDSMN